MMKPMMASIGTAEVLKRKGFIFEPKLDGTRAFCICDFGINFINRKGRNITRKYPELGIRKQLRAKTCILDGEIVMYDDNGNPKFELMLKREQASSDEKAKELSKTYPATYVAFDILEIDGKKVSSFPLIERKKLLDSIIKENKKLEKMVYTEEGEKLWNVVLERKTEGVVAKKKESIYNEGSRATDWVKIKALKTIDAIIIGYKKERRELSSLALGLFVGKKLTYIGNVGTGFSGKFLEKLAEKLRKMQTEKPAAEMLLGIIPVKPKLVCEVRYLEVTGDKKLRAPSFLRLRTDKTPSECTAESQLISFS